MWAYLEPFMCSDLDRGSGFPLVRLRDGVALVGVDTALSRPPLMAGGRVGPGQLARLQRILADDRVRRSYPVLLMHHPPFRRTRHVFDDLNGLRDYPALYRCLDGTSCLLIHGHLHRNSYLRLRTDSVEWNVVGVASATRHGRIRPYRLSSFHLFDVDGEGISSIKRYTLDNEGGGFSVTEVDESEFGVLVPGRGRTCLEDPH
jgi:3',5'-cyclic AMP phosphodiesterase CpdA